MRLKLRPVEEQVMVITGADSGIGLATARAAAKRGAQVVLCSRNAEALESICNELRLEGGRAEWYAGDVADELAMRELADLAMDAYGRIDTWINNAGVSVFGRIDDVPISDARRVFETNYWGMVNGSLAALPHLRQGGALINLGSVVSDQAIPLQGHYSATKHAVKAFTDALRMELEKEGAPISVTLVKPGSTNTPYTRHAANRLAEGEPEYPPPVYAPELVAETILSAAEHPVRSITVGGGSRMMGLMGRLAPALSDRYMERFVYTQQTRRPTRPYDSSLHGPNHDAGEVEGDYPGHVMRSSPYTRLARRPALSAGAALGIAAIGMGLWYAVRDGWMDDAVDLTRERLTGSRPADFPIVHVDREAGTREVVEPAPADYSHQAPLM
jgi:NAD(P)-dependent dehydrogenase (short-subunit alcohol dehydrogenase family)